MSLLYGKDERLLKRVKKGDTAAMHELYRRYARYLTAISARYLNNDEDIRDVLQDSFMKIFSSIDNFEYRGEGSLKAWMARITLNETLKFLRNSNRFDVTGLNEEVLEMPDGDIPSEKVPAGVIFNMIRELPEGYRAVFNLYVIEGRSHKEIAELLGISENTSASQLHRAKAILAKRIKEYINQ